MVTSKVSDVLVKNPVTGFLSWFEDATFQQREVKSFVSVGRDLNQMITLEDPHISRHHIRIERSDKKKGFILKDMRSRNGTFLNGNRVDQAWVQHGDRILIGKTELVFSFKRFNYDWKVLHTSLHPDWSFQLSKLPFMAKSSFPVLILGESGTGKEHLAQMVHNHSPRSSAPYVSVNCSALTQTLLESELFGHIKGSYTGADRDRKGAFFTAHKGTLFLDEIGDLPLHLQPKLLRAIECQEIKPVGSDQVMKVDVRIVSATHQDLKKKILDQTFRQDLYYRLNVLNIHPLALRDRMEDFDSILELICTQKGVIFSSSAIEKLKQYSWPGNIRELKNVASRAQALFPKQVIKLEHLAQILQPFHDFKHLSLSSQVSLPPLKKLEREMLIQVLAENNGNQKRASDQLQIPRTTLGEKLKQYGIKSSRASHSS